MSQYYHKYLKYKNKYLNLKNKMVGGGMNDEQIQLGLKLNEQTFFDKGNENIWMEPIKGKDDIHKLLNSDKESTTISDFETKLSELLDKRYYIRNNALNELFNTMTTKNNLINLNFLDNFYINLFKGLTEKTYFPDGFFDGDNEKKYNDLIKRFRIYSEWVETSDSIPKQKFYALVNKENPCDLTEIILDKFNRKKMSTKKYNFENTRELGSGSAGRALLFNYAPKITELNNKLSVVTKVMGSDTFTLKNNGRFLPLDIIYYTNNFILNNVSVGNNRRFVLEKNLIENYDKKYKYFNCFNTNNKNYPLVSLAVSSDNFTNQTILHMILENIFTQFNNDTGINLNNYVKQFDAMLCLKRKTNFKTSESGYLDYIQSLGTSALNILKKITNFDDDATVNGINMMEVANDDLYNHLFQIHKKYFSKIRTTDDLNKEYQGSYKDDHNIPSELKTNFEVLNYFFEDMIKQIIRALTILSHPKYHLIHGDLKTKNIFVRKVKTTDDKISYIYKLADYDKSSISFNGIRFHNEGNKAVKALLSVVYPKFEGINKVIEEEIPVSTGETISIKNLNNLDDLLIYLKNIESEKLIGDSLIYILINNINEYYDETSNNIIESKIAELLNNFEDKIKSINYIKLLKDSLVNISRILVDTEKIKLNFEDLTEEKNKKNLSILIKNIYKYYSESAFLEKLYSLNGIFTRLSLLIPKLEKVEMEQLFVRYIPTPFYNTIDLYTLFLSLLQSPLVKIFFDYCMTNKESSKVQESNFWNSFKDLWVNEKDIFILLGYYTYLFKNPILTDDPATINFILDPIKKNDIYLFKYLPEEYYKRFWITTGVDNEWDKLTKFLNNNYTTDKKTLNNVKLSTGSLLSLPQIALNNDCSTYSTYFHRQSKVFLVNRKNGDIVESLPDIGKTLWAIKEGTGELDNSVINREKKRYLRNLLDTLVYYLENYHLQKEAYDTIFKSLESIKDQSLEETQSWWSGIKSKKNINKFNNIYLENYLKSKTTQTGNEKELEQKISLVWDFIKKSLNIDTDDSVNFDSIEFEYINFNQIKNYININMSNKSKLELKDIVKTNYYKDIFGNYLNWDYCMKGPKEFSELLEKIYGVKEIIINEISIKSDSLDGQPKTLTETEESDESDEPEEPGNPQLASAAGAASARN